MVHAVDFLEVSPIVMDQDFYWYYFDWLNVAVKWQGTILTKRKNLTSPQDLRNLRTILPRVPNGGWHFTNMGGLERIKNKMISTVDSGEAVEKSNGRLLDETHLKNCLKNGLDIWDRGDPSIIKLVPCDFRSIKLPYLEKFVEKYPNFLKDNDPSLK